MTSQPTPKIPTNAECAEIICQPGGPFEIIEGEILGRRQKMFKNVPPHFRGFILAMFTQWKDREFINSPKPEPASKYDRESLTYGEALQRGLQLAGWLRSQGVVMGDHVAIGGGNSTGWVVSFIAVHLLGAVPVYLNSILQLDAQIHCLKISHPKIVLVDAALATILGPHAAKLKSLGVGRIVCWSSIAHLPAEAQAGLEEVGKADQSHVDEAKAGRGCETLGPLSKGNIFFTSGTTGYPKAVLSLQHSALHNIVGSTYATIRGGLRQGMTIPEIMTMAAEAPTMTALIPIPLFHATGCLSWLTKIITSGHKFVFMRHWSVKDAIDIIVDQKVTVFGGVPSVVTAVMQSPLLPKDHVFAGLSYGGAPPPERLAGDIGKRWPDAGLGQGYGMTETNALHTAIGGDDYKQRPTSVGATIPTTEVKIVNPDTGKECPRGEIGIIHLRGANLMVEYYGNPEATRKAVDADGWLDSGDMGFVDADDFLYIRDRAKDIIIRGGENIAGVEVENAIYLDNRIAEAAAVPVPDPVLGELVGVCVSLAPGATATPKSITETVESRLRHPARPAIVVILDEPLPRNANGKIVKLDVRKIVQQAWKDQGGKPAAAKL